MSDPRIHDLGPESLLPPLPVKGFPQGEGIQKPFMEVLQNAITEVNQIHQEADRAISDLVVGGPQDLHQTMISLEKADISFQLMMQIRNKIISAYEEVMRMQI